MKLTFILILSFASVLATEDPTYTRASIVFIGTGARTPLKRLMDIEAKKNIKWDEGYGQITSAGIRQMYLLGQYMRSVHVGGQKLLPDKYDPSMLKVRSVDEQRNIIAAQSFALGLYPEGAELLQKEDLDKPELWQPPFKTELPPYVVADLGDSAAPFDIPSIPVVAYNKSSEKLLSMSECKKYKEKWNEFFKSKEYKGIYTAHKDFLDKLCIEYGFKGDKLSDTDDIHYFLDYLAAAGFHNKLEEEAIKGIQYEIYKNFFPTVKSLFFCNFTDVMLDYFGKGKKEKVGMMVLATDEMNVLGYIFAGNFKEGEETKELKFGSSVEMRLRQKGSEFEVVVILNGVEVEVMAYEEFEKRIKGDNYKPDCWNKCNN